jgi:hypothetical protein
MRRLAIRTLVIVFSTVALLTGAFTAPAERCVQFRDEESGLRRVHRRRSIGSERFAE